MSYAVSANPGQTIQIVQQVLDGYGSRVDGYQPQVDFVLKPDLINTLSGFPTLMTAIVTGLYRASVTLPTGISAVGSYVASISWINPDNGGITYDFVVINCALPFGNSSIAPV